MKKIILRFLAFALDLGLVSLIIYGVSMLSFVNPKSNELNRMYKSYYKETEKYGNLLGTNNKKGDMEVYFEDEMLSESEDQEILSLYNSYHDCFKDVKLGEKATTGDINKVKENITEKNMEIMNKKVIEINKTKYMDVIISLVVYVLYFGVLQYFMKGQTPFKRLFRIKVVDASDDKRRVSLISFIVRGILITEAIVSLTDLVLLFKLPSDAYINVNYWITQIKYIYEMAFLVTMVIRDDNRSIHDLILNTRVLRYDKDGHEIVEQLFSDDDEEDSNKAN